MDHKDKIGYSIGFVILIAIGLWAIADLSATEGYDAVGRSASLKQLVADYWGRKLGVAMVILGALALIGVHSAE